jgi:CRISPR/Cas system CSM-associated protein Csm3 (group 7 of RAMP superfamily)
VSISAPKSYSIRHLARVVIEFTTAFHVGSGEDNLDTDAQVVADANGLPAIPGSSLAGALRGVVASQQDKNGGKDKDGTEDIAEKLFGYQKKDEGHGSRLAISWAAIHDSTDTPVDAWLSGQQIADDPVLKNALALQIRDHVRISHLGASDTKAGGGKFDEQAVCAGHRFAFELELVAAPEDKDWDIVLECLHSEALRLGGKSRRGYGAFKVIKLAQRSFNLDDAGDFADYANHPARLSDSGHKLAVQNPLRSPMPLKNTVSITLRLKPRGYWMFGGGDDLPEEGRRAAEMVPVRGKRIQWTKDALGRESGAVEEGFILPGTGFKGPLAHRVAFHYNRLNSQFADQLIRNCKNDANGHQTAEDEFAKYTGIKNEAVRELFGYVEPDTRSDSSNANAARGQVLLDDVFWPVPGSRQQFVNHVSIDRFTGGAVDQHLFSERPLWQGEFLELKLTLLKADQKEPKTRQALKAALDDLACGRLALGAGAGRGNGFFESAAIVCSAGDEWFNLSPQT